MNKKIEVFNTASKLVTLSNNIAEVFGKRHKNVMAKIENLGCSEEFRRLNFKPSSYISSQNKVIDCYEVTKDGFTFLCMGFSGDKASQFKEGYIAEFNRMAGNLNSISARINEIERERVELKESWSKWSEIGHDIRRSKKEHETKIAELLSEIQLKLEW